MEVHILGRNLGKANENPDNYELGIRLAKNLASTLPGGTRSFTTLVPRILRHPLYPLRAIRPKKNDADWGLFHTTHTLQIIAGTKPPFRDNDLSLPHLGAYSTFYFTHLYTICRITKPDRAVETGVGAGVSTSFILQALQDNGKGELYSIDLPGLKYENETRQVDDTRWLPEGASSGWAIPDHLRDRWHLIQGDTREKLPTLLQDLGEIQLFFHDSEHTYKTMTWEYDTAWPHIVRNGILASHDVNWNTAFTDFANRKGQTPNISRLDERFGYLRRQVPDEIPTGTV